MLYYGNIISMCQHSFQVNSVTWSMQKQSQQSTGRLKTIQGFKVIGKYDLEECHHVNVAAEINPLPKLTGLVQQAAKNMLQNSVVWCYMCVYLKEKMLLDHM